MPNLDARICQDGFLPVILQPMLDKIGNMTGWMYSVALAGLMALTIVYLDSARRVSGPTDFGIKLREQGLDLPTLDASLLPTQDQSDDGGKLYWQIATEYHANGNAGKCKAFEDDPTKPAPALIEDLVAAGRMRDCTIYTSRLDKLLNFDAQHDEMDNLKDLGANVNTAAFRLVKTHQVELGEKYAKAVIALGQDLIRERYSYEEFDLGLALTDSGLAVLADAKLPGVSDTAEQCGEQMSRVGTDCRDIWKVLGGRGEVNYSKHTGDMLFAAAHAKDKVWRDEAILQLGRIRFAKGTRDADSNAAKYYADKLSLEHDQVIATAGKASANMTEDIFQGFH